MLLTIPRLTKKESVGQRSKKNLILQLIEDEKRINFKVVNSSEEHLVLENDLENQFCLVLDTNNMPEEYEYVLLANKIEEPNLLDNDFRIIKWLKHPLLNSTPSNIVNSWKNKFNFKEEDIENNIIGLRNPQIGAIHSILGHLTNANDIANVVLPTGTGKTETMLSVLVAHKCEKLLVTVPSDSLRTQLAGKFYDFGWLKKKDINGKSILDDSAQYPIIGILQTGFNNISELEDFFNKCNVIISTMDLISSTPLNQVYRIPQLCSHLFVDEAHHSKANNWNKFIQKFEKDKVIQFTATPYRNDGKILDGKIIYNFSLKNAQEQGYFKEITFIPIREYYQKDSDIKISEVAVQKLREDLSNGFDHILMARCENKKRAEEIFDIYSKYSDLSPVLIHSTIKRKNIIKNNIVNKQHRIIVCVDMLGEGFDLPELKIAAFHDIRKSLPITLQFAGRFTRTSRDSNLGNATFVANLHQPKINDEISLLYAKESNWNSILPTLSLQATQEQVDLQEFLSGFSNLEDSIIPFQEIRPAFSAVTYKNQTNSWHPSNFKIGIKGYENFDYKFHKINSDKNTLVILLGNKKSVDWGSFNDVYNIEWNVYIVYWEQRNNLLFINSSEKGSHYQDLAKSIIGDDAIMIKDENVFKSFHNIDRIKLFNVGLRKGQGKNITFQSYYGKGVQEALTISEEKSGINNNVFGVGFELGEVTSIGCSRKGRIWTYSRGTINEFLNWCDKISEKLSNTNIDPNEILLKNAIKPKKVSSRPTLYPIGVDWNHEVYKDFETKISFHTSGEVFDISNSELNVFTPSTNGDLLFSFDTDSININLKINLSEQTINNEVVYSFEIEKVSGVNTVVKIGAKSFTIEEFFNEYPPQIWFADGSFLQGNDYVKFNEDIVSFPKEDIIGWDWQNVDISKESENFDNLRQDSIQYYFFQKLLLDNSYDIIFNDDNSGEIADIITIKDLPNEIKVEFYHLKYAVNGVVSNEIKNLYEVCGQAQKSLIWNHKDGDKFINHLLKRESLKNKKSQTRLKKGTLNDLEKLLEVAKVTKPIVYDIYIVQPGFSKQNVSESILYQLGVTSNHIKKEGNINLKVISSN